MQDQFDQSRVARVRLESQVHVGEHRRLKHAFPTWEFFHVEHSLVFTSMDVARKLLREKCTELLRNYFELIHHESKYIFSVTEAVWCTPPRETTLKLCTMTTLVLRKHLSLVCPSHLFLQLFPSFSSVRGQRSDVVVLCMFVTTKQSDHRTSVQQRRLRS